MSKLTFGNTKADRNPVDRWINVYDAYMKGKKAFVTIPNPNDKETAKRFIRVPATQVYGDVKRRKLGISLDSKKKG